MSEHPRYSVVGPVFNEEALIESFYQRTRAVLEATGEPWEIVLVDDGSTDATPEILDRLQAEDPDHLIVLHFSRNFGHQIAITAGMDHARGDAVVIIDTDLQDPPEVIPDLIAKWKEGYDVVYGVRTEREGETWFKLFTADLFYKLIQVLTDVTIPMEAGDFRLLDRQVIAVMRRMRERHRFVRAMVAWVGFRQIGVPYRRRARAAGETKYPFRKMFRLALDAITGFSFVPLKLALWLGTLSVTLGLVRGLIWGRKERGRETSLLVLGGVQLWMMGILGEYVGRIYDEVRNRPLYIVREERKQSTIQMQEET